MRDGNWWQSGQRIQQLEELGLTERRLKWGVYWLVEGRTHSDMVSAWGGICERHPRTRSAEVCQFWWVGKNRNEEECRRLAKADVGQVFG